MNRTLGTKVGLMGLFCGSERADKSVLAIVADRGAELGSVGDHAEQAGATVPACSALVLQVCRSRHVSKILEAVVSSIAVSVIDVVSRPFAGDVQPRKPMLRVERRIHPDLPIPNPVDRSSDVAHMDAVAGSYSTRKDAGIWVVVEKLAKALGSQLVHHPILLQEFP